MVKQSLPEISGSLLGGLLRSHRLAARQRQADIARLTGLNVPTVRRLERGSGTLASFWRVLAALDLELCGRNLPAGATVGARLAALRRSRGVSQRQLAARVGVSRPTLIALERTAQGRLATLEAVLTVLGAGAALHPRGAQRGFYAQVGNSSLHHGWTTPAPLLEKLYAVFGGGFDLDPCSPTANRRRAPVKARVYFTAADNGLALSWTGRVFVNPPYGRPLKLWVAKARREVSERRAWCVAALVPARTDTGWWHESIAGCAHVFLLRGRLAFGARGEAAPFPSALIVWGGDDALLSGLRRAFPEAWYVAPLGAIP